MLRKLIIAAGLALFTSAAGYAQGQAQAPANTASSDLRKPSEILLIIEKRPDFARLEEMSWDDDGYYEIVYLTGDKARVEINIDARTGESVDGR